MHLPRVPARLAAVLTCLAGCLVACLVVATGVSAATTPAAPTAAATEAGPASAPAGPAAAVTLVTGDTATVTRDATGIPRVSMTPAGEHPGSFTTMRKGTDLYVVPASVEHLVPDTLDLELFNVTGLLAQGYGDAETDSLPSIGASAVRLPKKDGFAARRVAGGGKVWLDRRVTAADLDANLTRIGAPQAWDAGLSGAGVDVADSLGRLPAWHIFDLGVRVTSWGDAFRLEPGTLRFWASVDHGKRWHEGIVVGNRDGTYRVVVPGVLTRSGQEVSVRAEATAAEGRTVKQTVLDAYPVR